MNRNSKPILLLYSEKSSHVRCGTCINNHIFKSCPCHDIANKLCNTKNNISNSKNTVTKNGSSCSVPGYSV